MRLSTRFTLLLTLVCIAVFCSGMLFFLPKTESNVRTLLSESQSELDVLKMQKNTERAIPGSLPNHDADEENLLVGNMEVNIKDPNRRRLIEQRAHETKAMSKALQTLIREGNHYIVLQPYDASRGTPSDANVLAKRNKIREMMKFAWDGYKRHAWGANELKPVSNTHHSAGIFGSSKTGATIVDALDTLYLMELKQEFVDAKDWVLNNFDFSVRGDVSVFEVNIRFVGGLLSAYFLTGDLHFKDKARMVADKLLPAFNTPTGIPHALVNPASGSSKDWGWSSGGSILSEFGTLHLEFSMLTKITGDDIYYNKVKKVRDVMDKADKPNGIYYNFVNPNSGSWAQRHASVGALGDSFYEYLVKSWVLSGKTDEQARRMYDAAVDAIESNMVRRSSGGFTYLGDLKYSRTESKMGHLACFAGGMFALGASGSKNEAHYMNLGAEITRTCHESYDKATLKLGPESFSFSPGNDAVGSYGNDRYYILRPEVVESYFVMWRLTKDPKYREWGWEAAQALEKNCRVGSGFSGIRNVYDSNPHHDDVQQSFFLAETLKYLYLLFSEDDLININDWVFNTEAHPLPVLRV